MFNESFLTLLTETEGEYKDRGSKFIGYAFPVKSEAQFKIRYTEIKKLHPQAVHHCYAWVMGYNQEIQKFSDDGEPSNSAGRPILRAMLAARLSFTAVVVVRYFGGKLLGVPGLIAAYEGAASAAIRKQAPTEQWITEQYRIELPYALENEIYRLIRQFDLNVISREQSEQISIIFEVKRSMASQVLTAFRQLHHPDGIVKATNLS